MAWSGHRAARHWPAGPSAVAGEAGQCEGKLDCEYGQLSDMELCACSEKTLTGLSSFAARSQKTSGIGRLMVHVIEATELKACKPNGKCCFHSTDVALGSLVADDSSEH